MAKKNKRVVTSVSMASSTSAANRVTELSFFIK